MEDPTGYEGYYSLEYNILVKEDTTCCECNAIVFASIDYDKEPSSANPYEKPGSSGSMHFVFMTDEEAKKFSIDIKAVREGDGKAWGLPIPDSFIESLSIKRREEFSEDSLLEPDEERELLKSFTKENPEWFIDDYGLWSRNLYNEVRCERCEDLIEAFTDLGFCDPEAGDLISAHEEWTEAENERKKVVWVKDNNGVLNPKKKE